MNARIPFVWTIDPDRPAPIDDAPLGPDEHEIPVLIEFDPTPENHCALARLGLVPHPGSGPSAPHSDIDTTRNVDQLARVVELGTDLHGYGTYHELFWLAALVDPSGATEHRLADTVPNTPDFSDLIVEDRAGSEGQWQIACAASIDDRDGARRPARPPSVGAGTTL